MDNSYFVPFWLDICPIIHRPFFENERPLNALSRRKFRVLSKRRLPLKSEASFLSSNFLRYCSSIEIGKKIVNNMGSQ